MSYQGTEWARKITGNKGEKNVLGWLGHRLDQRINRARVTEKALAQDSNLSERQVRRILRQLEKRVILKKESGGRGPGNAAVYSFVGFNVQKADIGNGENRTFSTAKADIGEPRINRVRAHEEELKKQPNKRAEAGATPQYFSNQQNRWPTRAEQRRDANLAVNARVKAKLRERPTRQQPTCELCAGTGRLHQKSHIPGPRLIACPNCSAEPQRATA